MGNDEREPPFFFSKQPDMVVPSGMHHSLSQGSQTKDFHYEGELVLALHRAAPISPSPRRWTDCSAMPSASISPAATSRTPPRPRADPGRSPRADLQSCAPCGALDTRPSGGRHRQRRHYASRQWRGGGQQSSIAHMIWNIAEIIAHLSEQVEGRRGRYHLHRHARRGSGRRYPYRDRLDAAIAGWNLSASRLPEAGWGAMLSFLPRGVSPGQRPWRAEIAIPRIPLNLIRLAPA